MKKYIAMFGLALAGCVVGANASAAGSLFLSLPGVQGGSQDARHPGAIAIESYSFGVSSPTNKRAAGVVCSDLSLSKLVDVASTVLLANTIFGVDYPQAVLYIGSTGAVPFDILTLTMNNVSITSNSEGGAAGGGIPSESLSLHFSSVTVTFNAQDTSTGAVTQAGTTTLTCD